jgi:hypothetical protein
VGAQNRGHDRASGHRRDYSVTLTSFQKAT